MITIYSTADGKLFTDPKERAYIDAELLFEKKIAVKREAILNEIAQTLGYTSIDALRTFTRCHGVTESTLIDWILTDAIADNLKRLAH